MMRLRCSIQILQQNGKTCRMGCGDTALVACLPVLTQTLVKKTCNHAFVLTCNLLHYRFRNPNQSWNWCPILELVPATHLIRLNKRAPSYQRLCSQNAKPSDFVLANIFSLSFYFAGANHQRSPALLPARASDETFHTHRSWSQPCADCPRR